ncbi:helix-turn-helix domain-containing protein [Paenibacillus psychroresistens]|uniref:Helix-turn-helix domain-containing protein n=1 Tax=Paenibacillus psychroresistens TaxID=1778678 RepID=A0A6B8RD86_9BACL|nr:helix-turn-helix domain-containing protein [Paenibacillus psychroresistens]QGQ94401.1 helix-turn-helix domain-containing protein [Paenibacillus psychroresistens]
MILKIFQSKKYLIKIFLWITVVTLLIVSSFSALIYFNVESKVFKSEYENSRKLLVQMKFNIDYLDTMINNLTLSTYSNNKVKALMYLNEEETFDNLNIVNNLNDTIVANNSFIHSIYIYNNHKKIYYSTFNGIFQQDLQLDQALETYKVIPTLKAIVRKMGDQTVLSYVMYENMDKANHMDGAVILNIKLDWLLKNIKAINQVNETTHSQMYILDSKDQFIEMDQANPSVDEPLKTALKGAFDNTILSNKPGESEKTGFFTKRLNGEKFIVSYIHLENTGWTLLETKPYNEAYANLKQLLDMILFITAAVFIAALLLSFSVSRGIYRPVKRLIEQTSITGGAEQTGASLLQNQDEFAYLSGVYQQSRERLNQYNLEKNNNTAIMKLYFLKKLLINSSSLNSFEFEGLLKELNDSLSKDKPFVLCVLRIDNYKEFLQSKSLNNRELLRFAISNITTECISEAFVAQTVDMKEDSFTILLNVEDHADYEERLKQLLQAAQSYITNYYHVSISVAISSRITEFAAITVEYNNAYNYSLYRYIFGNKVIISEALIAKQIGTEDIEDVLELENKFIDSVRKGDLAKIGDKFDVLFEHISKLEYNDIMLVNMHLLHHFRKVIYELNHMRKEPISVHDLLMNRDLNELETLDEFKQHLRGILNTIGDEGKEIGIKGNLVVADTIKEIINNNYHDSELGAAGISAMLKLTPYKLSKISKEYFGMTIPEYINEIRLNKAVEWMENSKLSIQEIMRRVGVENESYFYKLFKAKFGTTPREYRAERS